ncbi:MAG TPA: tRNA 2-thiouridine(34) synthase MnmA [Candidatus Binatia bacterium]|nr:tRNA 2-thiouridine(34) synthase MnmA [Candidatus Binatia bacterium]
MKAMSGSQHNNKVVVAMSGGVDSSVAAGLLIEQGYDVQGVSLRMWEGRAGPRVCSDHRGAKEIAAMLGIKHTLLDLRSQFVETVVRPFAQDYLRGRTPNPCIACNRDFKLGILLNWANEQGADYIATGHYARVVRQAAGSHPSLFRGVDTSKDQSYFLFALSHYQLAHTLFPLGAMQKSDVRGQARRLGLTVADRPESQDICFGDHKALVESYARENELSGGDVVDRSGKVLGRHRGIHGVTIGQRRGLGISASQPLYVVDIEEESKRVVVGSKEELGCKGLVAENVNWIESFDEEEIAAEVQIRYRSPATPCVIRRTAEGTSEVRFTEDFPAVTPGQASVFYRGDRLLGGGWITQPIR